MSDAVNRRQDSERVPGGRRVPTLGTAISDWMVVPLTALVMFASSWIGLTVSIWGTEPPTLWLASGIGISALLALGTRAWPGILLGAFGSNVVALLTRGELDWPVIVLSAFIPAVGTLMEAGLGAFLFRRLIGRSRSIDTVGGALVFVGICVVMCLPSAAAGPATLVLNGTLPKVNFIRFGLSWWVGNFVGVMVVAPLFLNWRPQDWNLRSPAWLAERLAFTTLIFSIAIPVLAGGMSGALAGTFAFAVFPPLIWAAFRFGQTQVALGTASVAFVAVLGAGHGLGPFTMTETNTPLLAAQGFVWSLSFSTIAMAAAVAQKDRSERLLRLSQERLKTTFQAAQSVAFVTTDLRGSENRIVDFSPGAEKIFGHAADEVVGLPVARVFAGEGESTHSADHTAIREEHRGRSYETTLLRKNGEAFPALFAVHSLLGQHSNLIGAVELVIDISDLKQAQEASLTAARRWAVTFDAISDPVCLLDPDGHILQANRAMSDYLGASESELESRCCFEFVRGSTESVADCPFERMKTSLKSESGLIYDDERWLQVAAHPLIGEDHGLEGAVFILNDVTDQKRTQEELEKHRHRLQDLVDERTKDLRETINVFAGREVRMAELKEQIQDLKSQIRQLKMPIHENALAP